MGAPVFVWRDAPSWQSEDWITPSGVIDSGEFLSEKKIDCPWCGNRLAKYQLSEATTWDYYEYISWCEDFCGWYIEYEDFNVSARLGVLRHFNINSAELALSEVGTHLKRNFSDIYNLSWEKFEDLITDVFKTAEFYPVLTQRTRDGGADILLYHHDKEDLMAIVECKKYALERKVGVGAVRQLIGASVDWNVRSAYLVTSGNFTSVARNKVMDFQKQGYEIELIGASELVTLLDVYNDTLPPLYKTSKDELKKMVKSQKPVEIPTFQEWRVLQESTPNTLSGTSLAGSRWRGEESPGTAPFRDQLEVTFHENGELSYTDRGVWHSRRGTWKQVGARVMFEVGKYYAVYQGSVTGALMKGGAQNKKGWRWEWYLERYD